MPAAERAGDVDPQQPLRPHVLRRRRQPRVLHIGEDTHRAVIERAVPIAINVAVAVHIPAAFYVPIVVALEIAFARTTVGAIAVLILAARRFVKARLVKAWFLARFLARFLA